MITILLSKQKTNRTKSQLKYGIILITISLLATLFSLNANAVDNKQFGEIINIGEGTIQILDDKFKLPATVLATKLNSEKGSSVPTELNIGDSVEFTESQGTITSIQVLEHPVW